MATARVQEFHTLGYGFCNVSQGFKAPNALRPEDLVNWPTEREEW